MVGRYLHVLWIGLAFLVINIRVFYRLKSFPLYDSLSGFTFRPCRRGDILNVLHIHKELDRHDFSWFVKILLFVFPGKCCLIIEEEGSVLGLSVFYFNRRDIDEGSVHEGFIGVIQRCSGRGLATEMRRIAIEHFTRLGTVKSISSRITLTNIPSIRSGEKLGYELIESYIESGTNEKRGYYSKKLPKK